VRKVMGQARTAMTATRSSAASVKASLAESK
jgi:hypothetical protein